MTETEAKTKWCPYKKLDDKQLIAQINAHGKYGEFCTASDCMMWRQANEYESSGFCGLAGAEGRP